MFKRESGIPTEFHSDRESEFISIIYGNSINI